MGKFQFRFSHGRAVVAAASEEESDESDDDDDDDSEDDSDDEYGGGGGRRHHHHGGHGYRRGGMSPVREMVDLLGAVVIVTDIRFRCIVFLVLASQEAVCLRQGVGVGWRLVGLRVMCRSVVNVAVAVLNYVYNTPG